MKKRTQTCFTAIAISVLASGAAYAADLGPAPIPVLENWTGFSVAVGGGIGIMNADLNASGKREDNTCLNATVEVALVGVADLPCLVDIGLPQTNQFATDGLGDEGFFGTAQLAYDKQFNRWVAGVFADVDFGSGISARQRQSSTADVSVAALQEGEVLGIPIGDIVEALGINPLLNIPAGRASFESSVETDWSFTIGGRIGYLVSPTAMVYVLGGWTHMELDHARANFKFGDPFDITLLGDLGTELLEGILRNNQESSVAISFGDKLDGFTIGGGGEVKLGGPESPWSLKGEYRFTHMSGEAKSVTTTSRVCPVQLVPCSIVDIGVGELASVDINLERTIKTTANADLDIDLHTVRTMLVYRF